MWTINPIQDSLFHKRKTVQESKMFSVQRKIGDFHKDFDIQEIEKLAYHRSYYKILGKHHAVGVINKSCESTPGDISTLSDYAERFSFEPDSQL